MAAAAVRPPVMDEVRGGGPEARSRPAEGCHDGSHR